jgi:hypothetical protein
MNIKNSDMKDLSNSAVDRKNILNNNAAIQEVYTNIGFYGIKFEEKYRFTKQQVAGYFDVDIRTIERLLEEHKEELVQSGYELFLGARLKKFKEAVLENVPDTNVGDIAESTENSDSISKAPSLGIFTYKAFLNLGMLLSNSDKAKDLRSAILDIVIDVLNKKIGGKTKFINQREEEFLPSAIREYNYRKEFTNALDAFITDNKFKYAQLTDKIYKSIFKENAKEYRQILKLKTKESIRNTMYAEILDLISSYENGFADFLKKKYEGRKTDARFSLSETHVLFSEFEELTHAIYNPLKEKARSLMASRDMVFRDALHEKLKEYVSPVSTEDFEKFLGDKSKSLEERLEENKEVFKRLKNR